MSTGNHLGTVLMPWGGLRLTLKGVLEMVGWRRRDETAVNPTEIGVPSTMNDVNKHES